MVKKMKLVALHCSFPNLVEICSEVLLLWRYEVKYFSEWHFFFFFFFFFFAFFSMKKIPNKMISPQLESSEKGLQLWYCGKIRPKRKLHTLKGKLTLRGYKWILIDYNRLQKSNFVNKDISKILKSMSNFCSLWVQFVVHIHLLLS